MVNSSKALDYASLLAKELNGLLMKVHTVSFFLKPIFNNTVKHIYFIRLQCFQIIESENLNQRPVKVKVKVPVVPYCSIGVWDRRSHRICFNYWQLDPRFHQTHIIHNFFTATKPDLTSKGTSSLDYVQCQWSLIFSSLLNLTYEYDLLLLAFSDVRPLWLISELTPYAYTASILHIYPDSKKQLPAKI